MAAAKKIKKHINHVKSQVVDKLSILAISAFGLVAALAWNSAIQDFFQSQSWLSKGGPWAYALLVTVIAVIVTVWIGKAAEKVK